MGNYLLTPEGDAYDLSQVRGSVDITPNDSTTFKPTRGLYVGVSGDMKLTFADGSVVTRKAVSAGVTHPWSVIKVWATGTTATNIQGDY